MKQGPSIKFVYNLIVHSLFSTRKSNASLWIALLGISVGVLSLTSVIGTMNGLQKIIIDKLIQIESYDYQGRAASSERAQIINALESSPQIDLVVPFVDEFTFIESKTSNHVLHIRFLQTSQLNKDSSFIHALSLPANNTHYLERNATDTYPIIIGWNLAGILGVNIGDKVSIVLPGSGSHFIPQRISAHISNVFYSQSEYDTQWAFMSLSDYTDFSKDQVSEISYGLRLSSSRNIEKTLAPFLQETSSWQEKNRVFIVALKTEKNTLLILAGIIFCIIVLHFRFAMIRRINNKKDDIVSLRTLGARPIHIHCWFLGEAIAINIIGTIIGLTIGLLLIHNYDRLVSIMYYLFGTAPDIGIEEGYISLREILFTITFTWIVLLATTWNVVKKSARIAPVQVLHYE